MAGAPERLDDLLLRRATEGLDVSETHELEELLVVHRGVDAHGYERAAAAVCLAVLGARSALPSSVRARLERAAAELVGRAPAGDG